MERRIWILSKNLHFAAHFQFFKTHALQLQHKHFYDYILEEFFYASIKSVLIFLQKMQNRSSLKFQEMLVF